MVEEIKTITRSFQIEVDEESKKPPPNFLMLLLIPETVKYLRLTDNYAQLDTLVRTDIETNADVPLSTVSFKLLKKDINHEETETDASWNSTRIDP